MINPFKNSHASHSASEHNNPGSKMLIVDTDEFKEHVKEIVKMLNIDIPTIQSVAYLFVDAAGYTNRVSEFIRSAVPNNVNFIGGYSSEETGIIYLARRVPTFSPSDLQPRFKKLTMAESIYIIAHELRHSWQNMYHKQLYYNYNARNFDIIDDISEIDADAFAIAYVFSNKTNYFAKDFPNQIDEICLQCALDGGKRWNQSYKLAKEYGLTELGKIEAAKESGDKTAIAFAVANYKKLKN